MRILLAHNRYTWSGGEDEAFATEINLLQKNGHQVVVHTQDNRNIDSGAPWKAGLRASWSSQDYRLVRRLIAQNRLDLLSVHNFFPLISPSVYYAARAEGIPVVQTLHNYRLLCPAASFLRDGNLCEDCIGKPAPWPALLHKCYRGSRAQTAPVVGMIAAHHIAGTWRKRVDRYIALTPFMREKFLAGGFPHDRVVVKPNSVEDSGAGKGEGDHFVFVGRLSAEKGVPVLLRAWAAAKTSRKLTIVGTGPDEMNLRAAAANLPRVEFLGQVPAERARFEIGSAAAVVLPSIWYEGLSRVLIEAYSKGTPVIGSDLEPIARLIHDGHTGRTFRTGDAEDLAARLNNFPPPGRELSQMRALARSEYEEFYSDDVVYRRLMEIYDAAIENRERP